MSDTTTVSWDYVRKYEDMRAEIERLRTENSELRKLNIERCRPDGEKEEGVADWLRSRGFDVIRRK